MAWSRTILNWPAAGLRLIRSARKTWSWPRPLATWCPHECPNMSAISREDILRDLAELLSNFEGREYSGPIGPETLFFGELGFMSIDAVVLGEKLEEIYGRKFPFPRFLNELKERNVDDI